MKKINIDGKEYEINIEEALAKGVLKRKVQHKIGNKYKNKYGGTFILSAINANDGTFFPVLIHMGDGYSYHFSGIKSRIKNGLISDEEFSDISYKQDPLFSIIE